MNRRKIPCLYKLLPENPTENEVLVMKRKVQWITRTAVMLALLVTLQTLTKGFGQIVTGSCVNAVLAVSVLVGGIGSGVTVALISPVYAPLAAK